jgi:hypothetical protein
VAAPVTFGRAASTRWWRSSPSIAADSCGNSAAAARFASASAPGTGSAAITDATSVVMNVDTAASATRDTDARTTRSKLHRRGSAEQASSCLERPHELGLGFNEPPLPRLPWCA